MSHSETPLKGYERVVYDDRVVRAFAFATVIWGIVGMTVGLILALQLAFWPANVHEFLTFGRLRPLHTNAVIFAFAGNAIFTAVYYSTQRLTKARMFNDKLSWIHFWGWQLIIVSAAITLPLGITQSREYAELEWPIDLAITFIWVVFAVNFLGTLWRRREKHIYVALWFYIASIVTVAVLHIFNNLIIPVDLFKGYSLLSGVQDAMVQWWYGHNAVAFFLTTPFLGLMYYFLPKAAERPVFSYKLSIIHFWSLVFLYIWAGPHHLHYTALPEWASTVGMVFSVMLWMPSWGGMINGLLTLRGAWGKLRDEPVLKFFVVGITFYGMSTFEGPMLSIKAVNSLGHYTDWIIAHVHSGALGWNGFMTFGMIYWLVPRLWKVDDYSKKLANWHFWLGTIGMLLYVLAMYWAGVTQGLMWRAFDETGKLMYPDFMETVIEIVPMYWVRVVGGSLYILGVLIGGYNLIRAARAGARPDTVVDVPTPTWRKKKEAAKTYDEALSRLDGDFKEGWHRALEGWPMIFTVLTTIAILIGSVIEIVPMLIVKSNVPRINTVTPYTPLELEGRDIYVAEGCYNCHSQMVRPMLHEIERYGEYSKPGEFIYDHPFQWGSKRTGPDLHRVGGKYPHLWHVRHMEDPRLTTPNSIMPKYGWLLTKDVDFSKTQKKVEVSMMLGVPYKPWEAENAVELAKKQAKEIADEVASQDANYQGLEDKQIIALVAYLQRLGVDIKKEEK
ncbi:cytochrome-c oxidase, cbb3-type subunit I [Microvenator marinus]|uniref:Cytochrome-c oxidase, cbb3-type subunit I n=1 Tax=Microvenator marinus TaxID=2600177 RepID=A0A5B8XVL1_9DELT|nr:cytochrome-c oxidase, cbb3-type subunit I [Microvenator marinus]QED27776.1 cytochrome-c oxidase, cbb3-type subunit I [Microvenator marinus]